jgi:hypothetical protein
MIVLGGMLNFCSICIINVYMFSVSTNLIYCTLNQCHQTPHITPVQPGAEQYLAFVAYFRDRISIWKCLSVVLTLYAIFFLVQQYQRHYIYGFISDVQCIIIRCAPEIGQCVIYCECSTNGKENQISIIQRVLMMVYNTENYWVSGLCPSSSILNTSKHISETGSVSVLGWREGVFHWKYTVHHKSNETAVKTQMERKKCRKNLW